ncbi:hypothetical protein [Pseudomonas fragi]|uniref:Uncharacterized protein n=1 Tax=Pseudomonas fragi TaxID=296 RepID=A0A449IM42_PSEFR|nr:hypothetical protein [Pseudomonas fragi]VFB20465.1 Uncharacterised protein [Pseudomonas fragi]
MEFSIGETVFVDGLEGIYLIVGDVPERGCYLVKLSGLSEARATAIIEHHKTQVLELREEVKALNISAALATGKEADLGKKIVALQTQLANCQYVTDEDASVDPGGSAHRAAPEVPNTHRRGTKP